MALLLGTSTITISGVSGSLTNQTTLTLTVTASGPIVSLSPTSLTFPKTVVGVTSKAKAVTLTNTGASTLNITSIAASGDFSVQSTTCGSTLAVNAKCTVNVTFTPTQPGTRTGSLAFTDNAPGSPQTVGLTGTGVAQTALTPASANVWQTERRHDEQAEEVHADQRSGRGTDGHYDLDDGRFCGVNDDVRVEPRGEEEVRDRRDFYAHPNGDEDGTIERERQREQQSPDGKPDRDRRLVTVRATLFSNLQSADRGQATRRRALG